MRTNMMHPADQLVSMMKRIYGSGLTTMSGGNLSIRDSNGDIWVTPSGIDKGTLTRSDIVCLHPDGTRDGHHQPTSELAFHRAIYAARSNIQAILHAHSTALMTFSVMNRLPVDNLIPVTTLTCGRIRLAPYARQGSTELGELLAGVFQKGGSAVIMENHGIVVAAESLGQAFMIFETLEYAARSELLAARLGPLHTLTDDEIDLARTSQNTHLSEFTPRSRSSEELALRRDIVHLIHRSIEQKLFTSSQGTISARLSDGSLLITPYGQDRRQIDVEDLVLVRRSMKESGKVPSRAVFLHELIYYYQQDIRAIISAQPPFLMAFTLTDTPLNCQLTPESHILLHQVPLVPYGLNYTEPKRTASLFSSRTPAVLLQNDGIIVTAGDIMIAYDRTEVAEFTARTQLAALSQGDLHPLSPDRIADLDQYFV